jgi:hypothetical protein
MRLLSFGALTATVATDSNTMDAYNVPKWLPAVRRPQLALALRRERRKLKSSRQIQFGHPWHSPPDFTCIDASSG